MSITITKVANGFTVTVGATLSETVTKAVLSAVYVFSTFEDAAYFIQTQLSKAVN